MNGITARLLVILKKGPSHIIALLRYRGARKLQVLFKDWEQEKISFSSLLNALNKDGNAEQLANHFRQRSLPHFFFSENELDNIKALVSSEDKISTIAEADKIVENMFTLRGQEPVRFNNQIDWLYCPHNNTDWKWELNRHSFFVTLGRAWVYTDDTKYVSKFSELFMDWMNRFPPGVGAKNWDSPFEVGFRINTWIWAYALFKSALDDKTLLELVRGIWWHLRFLDKNLEYASPNNHLLLEAKALVLGCVMFPEIKDSVHWLNSSQEILNREIRLQFGSEGVHREQSTLYHRIISSELFELRGLLAKNSRRFPSDIDKLLEMVFYFDRSCRKPDGSIPLLSDSALVDSYAKYDLAATSEDNIWLGEKIDTARVNSSVAFPEAGYFFLRSDGEQSLTFVSFDCGPLGYERAPGHGHADSLSFELFSRGRDLIVDSGVYGYYLGSAWRQFFRGTSAHNTIVIDHKDQTDFLDDWRVRRPAKSTIDNWCFHSMIEFVSGAHDGYTRLENSVVHKRKMFFIKPDILVILDNLEGPVAEHTVELLFHLMPDAALSVVNESDVQVDYPDNIRLLVSNLGPKDHQLSVMKGETDSIQGWVSFYSGEKIEAPVICYSWKCAVPTEFISVVQIQDGNSSNVCEPTKIKLHESERVLEIINGEVKESLYLGGGSGNISFAGCSFESELAYWQTRSGNLTKAVIPKGGSWEGYGVRLNSAAKEWE